MRFDTSAYTNGWMASSTLYGLQNAQMFSNIAAQMQTAPVHVHVDLDGKEIANATALPMSYALENLRVAEMRG